jgi:hypothetical protein
VRLHPIITKPELFRHIFPGTRIQTITPIYRQVGRLVRFTARVSSECLRQVSVLILKLCVEVTANLIIHMLSVDPKWVHPLPMNVPTLVPESGGVTVTLIEANHCRILFIIFCESNAYKFSSEKVQAHRCSFSRGHRQFMLVIVLTNRITWARAVFFGTSTVATSGRLLNTHSTKPSRGNELILYI